MLIDDRDSVFEEIYAIYEEAFPETERRTYEGQLEAMRNPHYQLFTIEENGQTLAFLGCWNLPGCVFVEHLAVDARCRGKGYGRKLIDECLASTTKPVFLEIEPVCETGSTEDKRRKFYEAAGFKCHTFDYEQPPLQGNSPWIKLWILSYGILINDNTFETFKKEIYETVYKIKC